MATTVEYTSSTLSLPTAGRRHDRPTEDDSRQRLAAPQATPDRGRLPIRHCRSLGFFRGNDNVEWVTGLGQELPAARRAAGENHLRLVGHACGPRSVKRASRKYTQRSSPSQSPPFTAPCAQI